MMTTDTSTKTHDENAAADLLIRSNKGEQLSPEEIRTLQAFGDDSPDGGEPLEVAVIRRWQAQGEEIGAWKIAWTSRAARDSGGPGYRPFGYILESRMFPSGAVLPLDGIVKCALEPEICLTMGADLSGPDVTPEQARAAVSSVRASFEINSGHLPAELPRTISIGNSMTNWGLVLGEECSPEIALDSLTVTLLRDGEEIGSSPTTQAVVDDPYVSLARVASVFHRNGLTLEAGQSIITGAILPRLPVAAPGVYVADFSALGSVALTLT
jgi:2-keto-4-pentenoate hydratase